MADALRSGVSARLRPFEAAVPEEERSALEAAGDLEGVAAAAKPHALGPAVRTVRRMLRVLLRPWSAAQTAFNREISRHAVETATAARTLGRTLEQVQGALHALERRLAALEAEQDRSGRPPGTRSGIDLSTLEWMFVHSRLPRPPGRVLTLGSTRTAGELASHGFDVFTLGLHQQQPRPRLHRIHGAAVPMPFRDGAFDAVLLLFSNGGAADGSARGASTGIVAEAARVLAPGGQLLLTAPDAARGLRDNLGLFTALEIVATTPDGEIRNLSVDELLAGSPAAAGRSVPAIFVRAERLDASGR
jgi:SAM-dependent methyltransferase